MLIFINIKIIGDIMKMINKFILYKFLNEQNRAEIKTTCDLYLNLVLGYFCILSILAIVGTYLMGLTNLILLDKDLASIIFYKTINGEPKNFVDFSMSFFSLMNGIIAVIVILAIFVLAVMATLFILFWTLHKGDKYISKLNWSFSSSFCRPLTLEERTKIKNME